MNQMKYQVVFKLKNMPRMVLCQVAADTPSAAGREADVLLQKRILPHNFQNLEYAKVLDPFGVDSAILRIDKDKAGNSVPMWLQWLTIHR